MQFSYRMGEMSSPKWGIFNARAIDEMGRKELLWVIEIQ
jgi:hypothetical protein